MTESEATQKAAEELSEAFSNNLAAYNRSLEEMMKRAADAIVQAFKGATEQFRGPRWEAFMRSQMRAINPHHRAKFHRHPKRRALRK